jgi:hypothetical protein
MAEMYSRKSEKLNVKAVDGVAGFYYKETKTF